MARASLVVRDTFCPPRTRCGGEEGGREKAMTKEKTHGMKTGILTQARNTGYAGGQWGCLRTGHGKEGNDDGDQGERTDVLRVCMHFS